MTTKHVKLFAAAVALSLGASALTQPALAQTKPKLVKAVAPDYPRAAMRRNIEGIVVLGLFINESGEVVDAQVIEAEKPGVFDKSAISAAKKWKYEPGVPAENHRAELKFQLTD